MRLVSCGGGKRKIGKRISTRVKSCGDVNSNLEPGACAALLRGGKRKERKDFFGEMSPHLKIFSLVDETNAAHPPHNFLSE